MATIALYAGKLNQMPGLVLDMKKSVMDYKAELEALKNKTLQVDRNVCELEDAIRSIQASSQTQDEKIASLEAFESDSEQFIEEAVRIDSEVAEAIRQRQDDFYDAYNYLKPDCEKNGWERFCSFCKNVGEWCKEHWVMIVTVLVVIAIAVIAVVTFGVAVAAVAAIAGIVSLVLCAADVICVIATGGKNLSTVFRENGWDVLADIFQELQVGCDIVSIVFPAGAAIKTMSKVGIKSFAKASFQAVKRAFKESIEALGKNGFQKSFKAGMKNLGSMAFKTFIFDIDDFTRIKGGKRVWDLKGDTFPIRNPSKNWTIDGDRLIPSESVIPDGRSNLNKLTMAEIMRQEKFSDFPGYIPYKNGEPDFSVFSVAEADMNMKKFNVDKVLSGEYNSRNFSDELRKMNMKDANRTLRDRVKTGEGKYTKTQLEKKLGYKLTWHEASGMKKSYLVPTEIHSNVQHIGAVKEFKFEFERIPNLTRLVGNKAAQFSFRFTAGGVTGAGN